MAYAPFDLSGKVALVTGGNRGIGFGMAEALAQAGATVAIWGSNEANNTAAIRKLGGRAKAWTVNVADETQVASAMRDTAKHFGRIDTVFANAGIHGWAAPFTDLSTETWRRLMSVNLDGAFFTLREACRHMVERAKAGDPGGSLVGVASLAALEGTARNQAYAATKGGMISMLKSIAVEHARYGVRANSILPGWIATDMAKEAKGNPLFEDKIIPRIPMRRWGEASDFGGVAVYLASDASAYHSGDSFVIDGGYSVF